MTATVITQSTTNTAPVQKATKCYTFYSLTAYIKMYSKYYDNTGGGERP